jgi:excisionase family DNA binding protein
MQESAAMAHVMTVDETAHFLRIHPETLREKARQGKIPALKVGRSWRFQRERLEQWMAEGGDIPEHLVEAGMVAYIKAQIATGGDDWLPLEDPHPAKR